MPHDLDTTVERAHEELWKRFIHADGVILDYADRDGKVLLPTPDECATGKPNALAWWTPIENGAFFNGLYLPAACERWRRTQDPADKEKARRIARGLLHLAEVSDVPGFIARGCGTDGRSHYPLGSDDQTHPWFYGLYFYVQSGIPDPVECASLVQKMTEVANVLHAAGWQCPCDGAMRGQVRGGFAAPEFRGAARLLFMLRAMHKLTGNAAWLERYRAAAVESGTTYGAALPVFGPVGTGACIDVTVADGRLFAIGAGELRAFDLADPLHPAQVGSLSGLGNLRQIEIANHVAYVTAREDGLYTVYRPAGQVHAAVAVNRDTAAVAVGNSGLHLIRFRPDVAPLVRTPTEGFALDVAFHAGRVYLAEGRSGLSIWACDGKTLSLLSRYRAPDCSIMQVVVPPPGKYALVENGRYAFEILDVSDPASPRLVLSERGPGLFYGKCITTALVDERYASVYWHMGGPVWYDLAATPPARITEIQPVIGNIINGMVVHENRLVVLHGDGYTVTTPTQTTPLKALPLRRLPGRESLKGIPSISQSTLFTCAGAWQSLRVIDIRDIDQPRLIEKVYTPGNPDRVVACDDVILIPDGHAGLRIGPAPQCVGP